MHTHPENFDKDSADASKQNAAELVIAPLSDYVRHAADYTRELADRLQGQKADELLASALTWSRKQPLLLVGGGIVLGFVLSQLVKGGGPGVPRSGPPGES
jgi:hypothetical protein